MSESSVPGSSPPFLLLEFPPELILYIFKFLLPDVPIPIHTFRNYDSVMRALPDLVRLACCNRALAAHISPLITRYRNQHPFQGGILSYARAIFGDIGLAQSETTFRILPSDANGPLQEGDTQLLDEVARQHGLRQPSTYREDLVQREEDIEDDAALHARRAELVYLILTKLRNVTSISFYSTTQPIFNPGFVPRILLPHLRHIRLVGFCSRQATSPLDMVGQNLGPFYRYLVAAPFLGVLEVENMNACDTMLPIPFILSLRFRDCSFKRSHLRMILWGCRRRHPFLQEFTYRTGSYLAYLQQREEYQRWHHESFPVDIVKQLKVKGINRSIRTLEIDLRERSWFSNKEFLDKVSRSTSIVPESYFIEHLRDFPLLWSLKLTQQTLWEEWYNEFPQYTSDKSMIRRSRLIDLLSPSVESFSLYDITEEFLPCIIALAEHARDKRGFPSLEEVYLRPSPDLIRQLRHAREHRDNPKLALHSEKHEPCGVKDELLRQRGKAIVTFKQAGIKVDFPFEVHPLSTNNEEHLQRQRDLGHWCRGCHFKDKSCLV